MDSERREIIRVSGLTRTFNGLVAVNNVSFSVLKGEIFAFLGPNGAGKTTTIKILTTLLRPSAGSFDLNGFDPQRDQLEARRCFGIVFQDPSLDDELTAWENMEFHGVLYKMNRDLRREKIEALLRLVELWNRRNDLVKYFSGGMKRRLEVARGLLHSPSILFLDEPTLGLDPQTRSHIWGYIQDLNRREGITVFFTTHYMEEADRVAHRIAIIDHGKIIIQGTPRELKETTGSPSLEDAFLALTGRSMRYEEADMRDQMRRMKQMWRR